MGDILAFTGAAIFIAGFYLLLGTAAALMLTGAVLIYVGWRVAHEGASDGTDN
jgi:hypothetical protein